MTQRTQRYATRTDRSGASSGLVGVFKHLLMLGLFSIAVYGAWLTYERVDQPIGEVAMASRLTYTDGEDIQRVVAERISGKGIVSVDLAALSEALVSLPWIRTARTERQWPNRLVISVTEHEPRLVWGDVGYVSQTGELIESEPHVGLRLPRVFSVTSSPADSLAQYELMSAVLAGANLQVSEMQQDQSGEWRLQLNEHTLVRLGRSDLVARIQRVIKLWEVDLQYRAESVATIDARYGQGLAVGWTNNTLQTAAGS